MWLYKVASAAKCDLSKNKGERVITPSVSLRGEWQLILNYFLSDLQVLQGIFYLYTQICNALIFYYSVFWSPMQEITICNNSTVFHCLVRHGEPMKKTFPSQLNRSGIWTLPKFENHITVIQIYYLFAYLLNYSSKDPVENVDALMVNF